MATKNKIWWLIILLLLAANTVTLVLFWTGRNQQSPQQGQGPQLLAEFLTKELQLDSGQQQQYQQLIQAHRSAAAPLRQKIVELKDSLFLLLKQGNSCPRSPPTENPLFFVQATGETATTRFCPSGASRRGDARRRA